MPIYASAGEEDEPFDFGEVSRAIEELIADGQDVTFDAKAGASHFEACDDVPELEAAREWLTTSVWTRPD